MIKPFFEKSSVSVVGWTEEGIGPRRQAARSSNCIGPNRVTNGQTTGEGVKAWTSWAQTRGMVYARHRGWQSVWLHMSANSHGLVTRSLCMWHSMGHVWRQNKRQLGVTLWGMFTRLLGAQVQSLNQRYKINHRKVRHYYLASVLYTSSLELRLKHRSAFRLHTADEALYGDPACKLR